MFLLSYRNKSYIEGLQAIWKVNCHFKVKLRVNYKSFYVWMNCWFKTSLMIFVLILLLSAGLILKFCKHGVVSEHDETGVVQWLLLKPRNSVWWIQRIVLLQRKYSNTCIYADNFWQDRSGYDNPRAGVDLPWNLTNLILNSCQNAFWQLIAHCSSIFYL